MLFFKNIHQWNFKSKANYSILVLLLLLLYFIKIVIFIIILWFIQELREKGGKVKFFQCIFITFSHQLYTENQDCSVSLPFPNLYQKTIIRTADLWSRRILRKKWPLLSKKTTYVLSTVSTESHKMVTTLSFFRVKIFVYINYSSMMTFSDGAPLDRLYYDKQNINFLYLAFSLT